MPTMIGINWIKFFILKEYLGIATLSYKKWKFLFNCTYIIVKHLL